MDVVRGHRLAPAWAGAAVAIGNFDGVHVGHRALLARAVERARARGLRAVAFTFDPHPAALLAVAGAPPRLTTIERRLELLAAAGLDAVVVEPFTRELVACEPARFVDEILLGALRARALVVGYDFSYGARRAGTIAQLSAHGERVGVSVDVIAPVEVGGEVVSSTKIRGYLATGQVAAATRMLGRAWDVDGVVIHGAARGRTIGVPTANVAPRGDLVIAPGIYAVTLAVDGGPPLPAVASLGTNPTFVTGGQLVLEVHVLDFDADLYERDVRVTIVEWLRAEAKFDSIDALLVQIRADIAAARVILG